MSAAAARIVKFRGSVRCHRALSGAPALTLTGTAEDGEDLTLILSVRPVQAAQGPAHGAPGPGAGLGQGAIPYLPPLLEEVEVDRIEADLYRIRASCGKWIISAWAMHLHREVAPAFYSVIRPQVPPWHRRALWSFLLVLAASPFAPRLIRWLRR